MSRVIGILTGGRWDTKIDYMRRVYDIEDTAPTIATVTGGGMEVKIAEPSGLCLNCSPDFYREPLEGVSRTLKAVKHDAGVILPGGRRIRVRKLTQRESFRLMGFTDEAFDKARAALNRTFYNGRDRSGSQLYKQAGNSIVVDNLMAIFGTMKGDAI